MRKLYELLFWSVCFSAAALLLVLSLMGAAKLTGLGDEAGRLEGEIRALETENRRLRAAYESSLDLKELERRATQELGLQHVGPGQIVTIPYTDEKK